MKMIKQVGSTECGLYAIGVATALAFGIDPTTISFNQDDMRSHLLECFTKQRMTPFPVKKKIRVTNNILQTVTVYVSNMSNA